VKPIIDATEEEAARMSERASTILSAFAAGGMGAVATATHLIAALRVLHGAAPLDYQLELEAYLAANLKEMRKRRRT
jgi:hypothetical protein